jgi:nicotinamidase-related amidase
LVHKQFNSAFEDTSLESQLAALNIAHLVLCGAATNWCIRATAYAALERGYDLTLIEDTHSTVDMPVSSELTIPAVTTAPNAVNSRHNRRINCGESS